jgi:hypothetical protein
MALHFLENSPQDYCSAKVWKQNQTTDFPKYHKVASTSLSPLEAHAGFFRLYMKGKFDVYLLWHFGKKNDFHIINMH